MSRASGSLEIAIVTHQTDAYLLHLLASIRDRVAPGLVGAVHVLDNASTDRTEELLVRFGDEVPWLRAHRSPRNLQHGPGLDLLLRERCTADRVLLLDSDTEVLSDLLAVAGALPEAGGPPPAFVGQIHPEPDELYAYVCHLLVHRPTYLTLPPFGAHGAPGLDLFRAVAARGLPYRRFRFRDHVRHFGQGALRQVHRRGDRGNPFFAFAAAEASRQAPIAAARDAFEAALRAALDAFLHGRPFDRGSIPPCPEALPAPPPRRRLLRGPLLLRTARKHLGLEGDPAAHRGLVRLARRLRPRRVVEVGTTYGGTLFLLTDGAAADATLVSVALPPWELDDPGEETRRQRLRALTRGRQTLHLVRRDPFDPATVRDVQALLPGGRADLIHLLDSAGGRADAYAPLLAPGGALRTGSGLVSTL